MSQHSHEDELRQFPPHLTEMDDDLTPEGLEDQHTRHEEAMELARELATASAFEEYFVALEGASKEDTEVILMAAAADVDAGKLSRNQFQRLSNLIEHGPETLEAFTKRINDAANALRPYPGRNLTPEEDHRVERLAETRNMSYTGAIELVLAGGLLEYEGNKPFELTDIGVLLLAEQITKATYPSEIAYSSQKIFTEARRRKAENIRALTEEEISELVRLNDYKLSRLKK